MTSTDSEHNGGRCTQCGAELDRKPNTLFEILGKKELCWKCWVAVRQRLNERDPRPRCPCGALLEPPSDILLLFGVLPEQHAPWCPSRPERLH